MSYGYLILIFPGVPTKEDREFDNCYLMFVIVARGINGSGFVVQQLPKTITVLCVCMRVYVSIVYCRKESKYRLNIK